jgi:hypothetical protein
MISLTDLSLGDIVLPWDRQVLGEWNHLFFFTYEIRNVPFNRG